MAVRSAVPKSRVKRWERSKGYRYIDKDPDMDTIKKIMDDSGLSIPEIVVACGGNISETTLRNWEIGKTRRPQNYTLNTVANGLGWERMWVKRGGKG